MATPTELKEALKSAAAKIAQYVEDASEMAVNTNYTEMGSGNEPKMAARTVVKLDGDSENIVPMKKGADGELVVDTVMFDLHQQNVQAAIDYRAEMLERLLSIIAPRE
jgi:hypothetical protein